MSERKLTPAQKAAIARNAAKAAKTTELSEDAAKDIGGIGDDSPELDNVFDKNKSYLKIRGNNGVTLIQDGCKFNSNGEPLSLVED